MTIDDVVEKLHDKMHTWDLGSDVKVNYFAWEEIRQILTDLVTPKDEEIYRLREALKEIADYMNAFDLAFCKHKAEQSVEIGEEAELIPPLFDEEDIDKIAEENSLESEESDGDKN